MLAEARVERDNGVLCKGITARYAFVKAWRLEFSVELMYRALGVSRSGYYDWLGRLPSARAQDDARLKVAIRVAHTCSRETYGVRRLQLDPGIHRDFL